MDSLAVAAELTGGAEPLPAWEGRDAATLAREWGLPHLLVYARLRSTSDLAVALARRGAPAGTMVVAEEQTAGRGRGSRSWSSPPGLGVWMSLVLRPEDTVNARVLPLLFGLAVCRALDPYCRPAALQVKWPNDVIIAGRKLAGILCEGVWEQGRLSFVVAGIGINVDHGEADFPAELRDTATSVRLSAGWHPSRVEIAGAVVAQALAAIRQPALDAATLAELEHRDALWGREVVVDSGGRHPLRGVAAGIAADGALRVRSPDGQVHEVHSGTVRPADGAVPLPLPTSAGEPRP